MYKADGRAHSDKFNSNVSLATIPSGGEAIVTVGEVHLYYLNTRMISL
ncbi:hypothetical protein Q0F98_03175 [Paenibacillus amylolyticus]|nr:hypothetical protein Q0F98_03175 [Paenibacillus amylolyticus]